MQALCVRVNGSPSTSVGGFIAGIIEQCRGPPARLEGRFPLLLRAAVIRPLNRIYLCTGQEGVGGSVHQRNVVRGPRGCPGTLINLVRSLQSVVEIQSGKISLTEHNRRACASARVRPSAPASRTVSCTEKLRAKAISKNVITLQCRCRGHIACARPLPYCDDDGKCRKRCAACARIRSSATRLKRHRPLVIASRSRWGNERPPKHSDCFPLKCSSGRRSLSDG